MMAQPTLQAISYLAPNWFEFYQAVTQALARSLGINIQLHQGRSDPLMDPLLLDHHLDLAFICGLPWVRRHQMAPDALQVLAAPVMQAARYGDRPIYFADVIVNASSDIFSFEDLSGRSFGCNDLGSNSGYNLVHWHVLNQGYPINICEACVLSGSHQKSLAWVLAGRVDWAAIDSTVLEMALKQYPEWGDRLRMIAVLGPAPMPPIVAAAHLGAARIQQLRSTLLHPDPELQLAMTRAGVRRYAEQQERDYEILAEMYVAVQASNQYGRPCAG
jgi:phosphonate transport system substrate-binding protein